jgi:ferredoxin-NADP reductase
MSGRFETTVLDVEQCGTDTLTVKLMRPRGYVATAGQWFRLTLGEGDGATTRTFTDAAAPTDAWLEVMTRLSGSDFKVALAGLAVGDRVTVVGPGGRLTLAEDVRKIAFLAGGVGITPARSILRFARSGGRVFEDAVVFYGNHDDECVPYLEELEQMGDMGVRGVPVYEVAGDQWQGETGLITAELLRRHMDPEDGRPIYVAGPPAMVSAFRPLLDELGIERDRRMIESFGAPEA